MNLNVIVHPHVMHIVRDVQLRVRQKSSIKSTIVLTDRRVKVRELVEAAGISHGIVISILHEQLGMKIGKMGAAFVHKAVDHKRDRVTISK